MQPEKYFTTSSPHKLRPQKNRHHQPTIPPLFLEDLLPEAEPELLALLPERLGQVRVTAVEECHLAGGLVAEVVEHPVPVGATRVRLHL